MRTLVDKDLIRAYLLVWIIKKIYELFVNLQIANPHRIGRTYPVGRLGFENLLTLVGKCRCLCLLFLLCLIF